MRNFKLGIIGGGQLGMLLVQKAIELPLRVGVLDPNPKCSVAHYTDDFTCGDLTDFETVLQFGKNYDAVTFEIEKVNLEALLELQKLGIKVISNPETLAWIKDKGVQREKLEEAGFPSPKYQFIAGVDVKNYNGDFPVVQKLRKDGYDGKGVNIIKNQQELINAPQTDSVFEQFIEIEKELSVLIARDLSGEIVTYDSCEMIFNEANLVDMQISPARITPEQEEKVQSLSKEIAKKLDFIGIYAIEMFITKDGDLLVNEISPRPHNSGHHTVYANATSQYEQQLRIALGLPLGNSDTLSPSVMLNLLGAPGPNGPTEYKNIEKAFEIPNCHFIFYGKDESRPMRKMGHVIILDEIELALKKATQIKETLTITTNE